MGIDARIIRATDDQGTMSMLFIEGNNPLQMLPRQRQLALHAERLSQWPLRFHEQERIILSVGQAEELFPERPRRR